MIVLHSFWDTGGRLHLWAESSVQPARAAKWRGKSPAKPRPHPLALVGGPLREAVGDISGGLNTESTRPAVSPVLLPSNSKGPLPSPELGVEDRTGSMTAQELINCLLCLTISITAQTIFKCNISSSRNINLVKRGDCVKIRPFPNVSG